uniref:Uncharacterized protein n=1 Tax=Arundo donax TaxID=35708 RepID=A0A0A9C2I2_ARUDO
MVQYTFLTWIQEFILVPIHNIYHF